MRLSVQIEFDKTLDLETNKNEVIVGRSPQCDLVIPHDGVSRRHCKIEIHNGHFYVTDLGSSNGVFIDGQRIKLNERQAFLSTQQLRLGGLECEVIESKNKDPNSEHKIISSTLGPSGDFTATVRLARIDINKPIPQLELEKKSRNPRVRNPVTAPPQDEPEVVRSNKLPLFILLVLVAAGVWYVRKTYPELFR